MIQLECNINQKLKGEKMKESNDSSLYLSWVFFKNNLGVSFGVIGVLFVLVLLSTIQYIGFVFSLLEAFLIISIGAFFAKKIVNCNSEDEMAEISRKTTFQSFIMDNLTMALGVYLGSLIVFILIFAIIGVLGALAGNEIEAMYYTGHISSLAVILIIIDVILLIITFYIYPAVAGEAYMSDNFTDAFKKMFLFLNPKFWKKTFNAKYMILVLIWMMVFPSALILSVLGMFVLVGFVLLFILSLYSAGIYGYAYNIVHLNDKIEIQKED